MATSIQRMFFRVKGLLRIATRYDNCKRDLTAACPAAFGLD